MPTNLTQKQIIIIGGGALVVIVVAVLIFFGFRGSGGGNAAQLNISIWGTSDARAMNDLIQSYSGPGSGQNAQIRYVQIDPAQYRTKLLSALAAGTGPDVFEIGNHDLPQWKNVLAPVPVSYAKTFSAVTLQSDFPDVVSKDFVSGGYIYALPLSIDTLAMIYNKDLFNTAGIATVPSTWQDLEADLPRLRQMNSQGQITQAAFALGGSEASIHNAPDILFLLMMQNGSPMNASDGTTVEFASLSGSDNVGLTAFEYYLQFANAGSNDYTWNNGIGTSVDAFAQGKVAAIFDYSSAVATIKAKSPFLNYGIAPMPQTAGASVAVNYAKYKGFGVSRSSANIAGAWGFIINLTTSAGDENIYTKDTGAPPALRAVIANDLTSPAYAVFAQQALTARSWREVDSAQFDTIMNTGIQNVLNGAADAASALGQAQRAMNSVSN